VTLLSVAPATAALPAWLTRNDSVEVTGLVTAPSGQALGDLRVVLELIRETRDLRSFDLQRVRRDLTKLATKTDPSGSFRLASPWTRYYNRMELVVGIEVQGPGETRFEELERIDLTPRLKRGGAAVVPVVVGNAGFIAEYRAFVAGLASPDEHRIFGERGRPDKVEQRKFGNRREIVWWYFAAGRVCRFVDGTLTEVEPFDPVLPLAPAAPLP
jgi:hypothetical protein